LAVEAFSGGTNPHQKALRCDWASRVSLRWARVRMTPSPIHRSTTFW
jgi:hypothetical protein